MQAEISETYPGSIVHFVDPGHGEIFIDEKQRPGSQICLMHLVPWYAQAMLPGSTHKTVVIYVNGNKSLTVPVADEAVLKRAAATDRARVSCPSYPRGRSRHRRRPEG